MHREDRLGDNVAHHFDAQHQPLQVPRVAQVVGVNQWGYQWIAAVQANPATGERATIVDRHRIAVTGRWQPHVTPMVAIHDGRAMQLHVWQGLVWQRAHKRPRLDHIGGEHAATTEYELHHGLYCLEQ
ncbi:hypothetical protein D3C80_1491410 [compost metagenome]